MKNVTETPLQELRRIRDDLALEFNYDGKALAAYLRQREAARKAVKPKPGRTTGASTRTAKRAAGTTSRSRSATATPARRQRKTVAAK